MNSTEIFSLALGLQDPWIISDIEILTDEVSVKELHIHLGFKRGTKFEDEAGKIEITGTKYITRPGIISEGDDVEVLGQERAKIAETVFGLKVGESAIAVEDKGVKKCYVVMLVDRKKVDPKEFEEEKDSIMAQYLMEKQLTFITEWESWIGKKALLGKRKG